MSVNAAIIALAALGHTQVPHRRCSAIENEKRGVASFRPFMPPKVCSLRPGHEGPHMHVYGTRRAVMSKDVTMRDMPDLCEKCGTRWPCNDAEKVITALNEQPEKCKHGYRYFCCKCRRAKLAIEGF